MEKKLFEDLVISLNEAIEHEKGNIKLRTSVREMPDEKTDEMYCEKFRNLPQPEKLKAMKIIDELYYADA